MADQDSDEAVAAAARSLRVAALREQWKKDKAAGRLRRTKPRPPPPPHPEHDQGGLLLPGVPHGCVGRFVVPTPPAEGAAAEAATITLEERGDAIAAALEAASAAASLSSPVTAVEALTVDEAIGGDAGATFFATFARRGRPAVVTGCTGPSRGWDGVAWTPEGLVAAYDEGGSEDALPGNEYAEGDEEENELSSLSSSSSSSSSSSCARGTPWFCRRLESARDGPPEGGQPQASYAAMRTVRTTLGAYLADLKHGGAGDGSSSSSSSSSRGSNGTDSSGSGEGGKGSGPGCFYYGANNRLPDSLLPKLALPPFFSPRHTFRREHTRLWVGRTGAGTHCHRDIQDNFVCSK
jgi:hypothetical protein